MKNLEMISSWMSLMGSNYKENCYKTQKRRRYRDREAFHGL
jgi:hypothetical protein